MMPKLYQLINDVNQYIGQGKPLESTMNFKNHESDFDTPNFNSKK